MRNRIFILIVITVSCFFQCYTLSAQEPLIKFYLDDGSFKAYKLNDIDSLNLIKSNSNYVMKIFYDENQIAYYPTEVISKIQFDKDSTNNRLLNVYVFGYQKSYKLSDVDSINFYIDIYQPLTIGSQVWMLMNLNVDHYRNGDPIPIVRDSSEWWKLTTGAWCYYNNDIELYGETYGKLYNWYAVNDSRGLAPVGWHVPSDSEWTTLANNLGGELVAGGKLKETGITHWKIPNSGATNSSGFSGIPGGIRNNFGNFELIGYTGAWWSSTEYKWDTYGMYKSLNFNDTIIGRWVLLKNAGFSVRCIKDNKNTIPIITAITPDSGSIGDTVIIYGTGFGSFKGTGFVSFNSIQATQYQSWNYTQIKVQVPTGAKSGKLSVTVNGIMSNEVDFKIIKYFDTVKIGTQVWMKKNLDVDHYRNGDSIPEVRDSATWLNLTTGAWCYYNNDPSMGVIYGKLYNWYAVNDPRGLAPAGWHVASDSEWTTLTNYLGGDILAGSKLKEKGTTYWDNPNSDATNSSKFSAIPGGLRPVNGIFSKIGKEGNWFSSTEADYSFYADTRFLLYNFSGISRSTYYKGNGLSVRCVKDK